MSTAIFLPNFKISRNDVSQFFSKCQKICEQLDSASGVETPAHEWFWPSQTVERTDSSDEDEPEEEYDSDSEKSKSDNSNSDTGEDVDDSDERPKKRTKRKKEITATVPEENPDFTVMHIVFAQRSIGLILFFFLQFLHSQLEEQVDTLMAHLRSKYFYCLWCGVQYKDAADLDDSCPGSSKDLH